MNLFACFHTITPEHFILLAGVIDGCSFVQVTSNCMFNLPRFMFFFLQNFLLLIFKSLKVYSVWPNRG
uniref:Uncharacterized protein n=1 Tax=Arundo donax TaxID=35708 RepID=A0A0A9F8G8_ARUDO